ncbi:MAG: GNAT family N-acetyltransferase [Lachnospiraceae bacterium]|nr:GNAT family N-acetyltransferase [Lachnospiraceae bacterium]
MYIMIPESKDVSECAKVYISAYREKPWDEVYEEMEVETYIRAYLNSDTKCCFAAVEQEQIVGLVLGLIVPCIGEPFFRIEDFCISPEVQRKGCGTNFMELIAKEAAKRGCDSILLGTQREFPSHKFYLKNGFQEIESVLLFKEIG